jgi:hypothetical protein
MKTVADQGYGYEEGHQRKTEIVPQPSDAKGADEEQHGRLDACEDLGGIGPNDLLFTLFRDR